MTLDALTYPLPRRSRTGPASSLDAAAANAAAGSTTPPRTRLFPWAMSETANTRRTISTPRLIGPAIFKSLTFYSGTHQDPPGDTLEIGWSPVAVQEAGVALATVRPYTVLTELLDPFAFMTAPTGRGFPQWTSPTVNNPFEFRLNLILTEPQFVFTLSIVNNSNLAQEWHGTAIILEAVNADALAAYTGD
jgi:hypothetical protein